MKVVLLIAITAITLVPGSALAPCVNKRPQQAYDEFVNKHVPKKIFDRTSEDEWAKYLTEENLCGREPKQSFINVSQTEVEKICSPDGRRKKGNLCMSRYMMVVYVISSKLKGKVCSVSSILKQSQFVTVACDNVENNVETVCRPVHFDKHADQLPSKIPCVKPERNPHSRRVSAASFRAAG